MKLNSFLKYLSFISIAMLVIAIVGLSINALRSQQDIRNQAATASTVDFTVTTGSTTIKPGQSVPIDLSINTKNKLVSGFTVKGLITGVSKDRISTTIADNSQLLTIKNTLVETKDGTEFTITMLSNPGSKSIFTTQTSAKKFASIIINPSRSGTIGITMYPSPDSVAVEHNKGYSPTAIVVNQSFVVSISADSNNTNNNDKKSCNENCATDTECKSVFVCYKGRCRVHTNREDDKCTVPAQKGLERSCNEYCSDSRECNSSLTCYYNRCRLATNIENTSCQKPAPAKVTTTGTGGTTSKGTTTTSATKSATVTAKVTITSAGTPSPSPSASPTSAIGNLGRPLSGGTTGSSTGNSGSQGSTQSPTPSPTATPQIVPLPSELQSERIAANQGRNNAIRTILIIVSALGIIGLIGFGLYFWKTA